MTASSINNYSEADILRDILHLPENLWEDDRAATLAKAILQHNLWVTNIPEANKHFFHDTTLLNLLSLSTAQQTNDLYLSLTNQPKFKLPFHPSCWPYIYNATEAQLKEDANFPPLHFAIKYQYLGMVKALLKEEGVDSIFQLSDENATVEFAATEGDPNFYVALFKMGYSNIDLMIDYLITNSVLDKPLIEAAKKGYVRVIPALIEAGAYVNAKDAVGLTPLHFAAHHGKIEVIRILVKLGADINAKDHLGRTPLHVAALDEQVEAIRTLVKLGADIHAKDNQGNTPLRCAARDGKIEAISILVELGADINTKDNNGKTPLHCAAWREEIEVIRILVELGADLYAPLPNRQTVIEAYPDLDFSQAIENYNLFNSTRLSHSLRAARCEALFRHSNSPKPSRVQAYSPDQ